MKTFVKNLITPVLVAVFAVLVISAVSIVLSTPVFAIEDQFIISQTVTGSASDTTAPSVPTSLTATTLSQSQIDLSWTASTDDTAVTGYQVFRDLVFVATTSATSYSDIGLSASTEYSYTVTAFDAAVNISAQSSAATATTLAPSTNGGGGGTGGSAAVLRVLSLTVSPDTHKAIVKISTNIPVQAFVYWGETLDYELGSAFSPYFSTLHTIELSELEAGTDYVFKVWVVDARGRELRIEGQEFTTLSLPDTTSPSNVSNFSAVANEDQIDLTWNNPQADFDLVRIVRSTLFYPRDPYDGETIYEGRDEQYTDTDVVSGTTYYYTAFGKDAFGNYSSGAIASATARRPGQPPVPNTNIFDIINLPKGEIDPLLRSFNFKDIDFIQDGVKILTNENRVEIRGDRSLLMSVDYEKMPEILKTIAVTLHDPKDKTKTFSFLLRVNADKTAYEANIAPLGRAGEYEFNFQVLDYKHRGLVSVLGTIVSILPAFGSVGSRGMFDKIFFGPLNNLGVVSLLLALIIILFGVIRNRARLAQTVAPKH